VSLRQGAFVAILLTILLAIAGDWSGGAEAMRLWCVPAALLLAGLVYERLFVRGAKLQLRLVVPARWRLARPAEVLLEFTQGTRRPLAIEVAPDAPPGLECPRDTRLVEVPAGDAGREALRVVPRRLGEFAWPAIRTRVRGPLGLAWWPQRVSDPVQVRVEPDLIGAGAALRGAERIGDRSTVRAGVGGEVLQLRDYRPGDPLRSIDWKATARAGHLIARDYAEDQRLEVVICLDAGRGSSIWCGELDRLGHYANAAARLAEHVVSHDDSVGLVVFGDQPLAALPPSRGVAAVTRMRALLTALEPQRTDSNPIHAAARVRSLVRRRCLVVLLTDVDDAASSGQLAAAVRLLLPQHLPLVAGLRSAERDAFTAAAGGDAADAYRALAAAEHSQRLDRAVAALHAVGVRAILARPEQLESEVVEAYRSFRRQRRV